jgi:hypothetical protein
MDRLGEVLYEEADRVVTLTVRYEMVVIEHQYYPVRKLRKIVY